MKGSMSSMYGGKINLEPTRSKQQGLAMIEVAITLPFLLVTLLATAEFSRAFYEYNTLTKGVRDAARFAVEDAYDSTKQFVMPDTAQVKNMVVYGNISGAGSPLLTNLSIGDVQINQRDFGAAPNVREHVEVTVTYRFQPLANVIPGAGFLPGDVNLIFDLVASSTMRAL